MSDEVKKNTWLVQCVTRFSKFDTSECYGLNALAHTVRSVQARGDTILSVKNRAGEELPRDQWPTASNDDHPSSFNHRKEQSNASH